MEWTLNSHRPLPTWIENKWVLIGDACHPMLPYVAQGAVQAIGNVGVLTCALSLIRSKDEIDTALEIYESVRKERGEKIQNSASETRNSLHLPDGEEQRKRDEAIMASSTGQGGHNPDLWADSECQDFMWGESSFIFILFGLIELLKSMLADSQVLGTDVMKDTVENWDK
jgi:salicylate hydroxylase